MQLRTEHAVCPLPSLHCPVCPVCQCSECPVCSVPKHFDWPSPVPPCHICLLMLTLLPYHSCLWHRAPPDRVPSVKHELWQCFRLVLTFFSTYRRPEALFRSPCHSPLQSCIVRLANGLFDLPTWGGTRIYEHTLTVSKGRCELSQYADEQRRPNNVVTMCYNVVPKPNLWYFIIIL